MMRLKRVAAFHLVIVTLCMGCAVQTTPDETAAQQMAHLEQKFARAQTEKERARIARQLVSLGTHDNRYWAVLDLHASQALAAERHAAAEWRRSHTRETSRPTERASVAKAGPLTSGFTSAPQVAVANNRVGGETPSARYSKTSSIDLSERDADLTNLSAIINLAMVGDQRAIPKLRRALATENVFFAAEAAMGLAKLKDIESIPAIERAASTFVGDEDLFAEALVFFGREDSDRIAAHLLNDKEALDELRARARAVNYNPYAPGD